MSSNQRGGGRRQKGVPLDAFLKEMKENNGEDDDDKRRERIECDDEFDEFDEEDDEDDESEEEEEASASSADPLGTIAQQLNICYSFTENYGECKDGAPGGACDNPQLLKGSWTNGSWTKGSWFQF